VKLVELRANPVVLLLADKSRAPRSFTVSMMRDMGTKRGGVSGSFIGEATDLLLSFYRGVVQGLRSWSSGPPKLPLTRDTSDIAEQPENVVSEAAANEAQEAARLGDESGHLEAPGSVIDESAPSRESAHGE
jgi:hypothetical protein